VVTVDSRDGRLVISSYSRTAAGFSAMNGWFIVLDEPVPDEDLGQAVVAGLRESRDGVPVPPRDANPLRPVYSAVGASSLRDYVAGTGSVCIYDGDVIEIIPQKNLGARDGFVEIADAAIQVTPGQPDAVGRAVQRGLARAT
jgi:hypothetical protein